jgi:hypothetical protein
MDEFILDNKGNLIDFTDLYIINVIDVDIDHKLSKDKVSLKEGGYEHLFNTYLYFYELFDEAKCSVVVLTDDEDMAWRLVIRLGQVGYEYNGNFINIR